MENKKHKLVVLIDDQIEFMDWAAKELVKAGFIVETYSRPKVALVSILNHRRPDAVITDFMMPGLRGTEVKVALDEAAPGLPVFLWSSVPADCPDKSCFQKELGPLREIIEAIKNLPATDWSRFRIVNVETQAIIGHIPAGDEQPDTIFVTQILADALRDRDLATMTRAELEKIGQNLPPDLKEG